MLQLSSGLAIFTIYFCPVYLLKLRYCAPNALVVIPAITVENVILRMAPVPAILGSKAQHVKLTLPASQREIVLLKITLKITSDLLDVAILLSSILPVGVFV
jgi:hypothetical protein